MATRARVLKRRQLSPYLADMYHRLSLYFGPRHWWPGESPFEIMVGAILTQNTAWTNVRRAIANLAEAGSLTPRAMYAMPRAQLAALIRPSGYFNQKAIKLHAFLDYFLSTYDASISRMRSRTTVLLREELLAVHGIGPETADSILLYALDHPVFVIDAYTLRSGARLGLFPKETRYHEAQRFFTARLPHHVSLYNEYHALLVALGHHFCKPTPLCVRCPLADMCPAASGVD